MSARDDFLARVRRAVAEGNRLAGAPPAPERGAVGYQGAGPDPAERFARELIAAGGLCHRVADAAAATAAVVGLLRDRKTRRALLGGSPLLDRLGVVDALRAAGIAVQAAGDAGRDALFAADAGVSGVDHLIAETGSVVLNTRPDQPRAVSLLPPLHVAVATIDQLLPDLFDLFEGDDLPSCLQIITGPSKTGDIELKLVTGVHGPGELHVVLLGEKRG
jgi:L-lactate utilization protein LutC